MKGEKKGIREWNISFLFETADDSPFPLMTIDLKNKTHYLICLSAVCHLEELSNLSVYSEYLRNISYRYTHNI